MNDVNKMKKAELLELLSETDSEVFTQATSEKWKVTQLREWLTEQASGDQKVITDETAGIVETQNGEDENNESEGDEDEKNLSNTMKKYRNKYTKATGYNGKPTVNNGDDLASVLLKLDPQEVVDLAEMVLGFENGELSEKYAHLNPGQQRMCSGNRIRAAIKKGTITAKDVTKAVGA